MKVSVANIKKTKVKKRGAAEGGAPQAMEAIFKRPRVAIGGPSALARALASHPPSITTTKEDDNEVEVISGPIPTILISSLVLMLVAAIARQPSTSARMEVERKG